MLLTSRVKIDSFVKKPKNGGTPAIERNDTTNSFWLRVEGLTLNNMKLVVALIFSNWFNVIKSIISPAEYVTKKKSEIEKTW